MNKNTVKNTSRESSSLLSITYPMAKQKAINNAENNHSNSLAIMRFVFLSLIFRIALFSFTLSLSGS